MSVIPGGPACFEATVSSASVLHLCFGFGIVTPRLFCLMTIVSAADTLFVLASDQERCSGILAPLRVAGAGLLLAGKSFVWRAPMTQEVCSCRLPE